MKRTRTWLIAVFLITLGGGFFNQYYLQKEYVELIKQDSRAIMRGDANNLNFYQACSKKFSWVYFSSKDICLVNYGLRQYVFGNYRRALTALTEAGNLIADPKLKSKVFYDLGWANIKLFEKLDDKNSSAAKRLALGAYENWKDALRFDPQNYWAKYNLEIIINFREPRRSQEVGEAIKGRISEGRGEAGKESGSAQGEVGPGI